MKTKVMFWGDSPTLGTGFGNVIKFIVKYLPKHKYDITVMGLHYDGTPHDLASLYGRQRYDVGEVPEGYDEKVLLGIDFDKININLICVETITDLNNNILLNNNFETVTFIWFTPHFK
jgi:hypothetical protein